MGPLRSLPAIGLALILGACHASPTDLRVADEPTTAEVEAALTPSVRALGEGVVPGDADGPGGFVPRGRMRNFYTGPRGRLWYYMNNYYWVPDDLPRDGLWIRCEVFEEFQDLRRWPEGEPARGPGPKVTVEYWAVGTTGRTLRLDNHRDFCSLDDHYSEGAIAVEVTLTLGRLEVADERGRFAEPSETYVLESRNYAGGGGVGSDRTRFEALPSEAVTVWGYRVPWCTHPQRLTRSNWRKLELPTWRLLDKIRPETAPAPEPVVVEPVCPVVTPRAPEDEGT